MVAVGLLDASGLSAQPAPPSSNGAVAAPATPAPAQGGGGYAYDPSGRRDPFKPIGLEKQEGEVNLDLPPLQRVGLTEVSLIAIIWGGYGYSAMVQTPDGKGYTVRQGTKIGPNSGVISTITENSLVVQERFTDVYGNKQVREYVKRLHAKEGTE